VEIWNEIRSSKPFGSSDFEGIARPEIVKRILAGLCGLMDISAARIARPEK
jgi:hypothetical protein